MEVYYEVTAGDANEEASETFYYIQPEAAYIKERELYKLWYWVSIYGFTFEDGDVE